MDHSDTATTLELCSWAIAIFCSTAAMFLAMTRPITAAAPSRRRRREQQRREQALLIATRRTRRVA